ncbi:hypothetical protein [Oceanobacillus halophilus]|nr:hypothetical protein [Oceanobacillus halophilus]
MSDWVGSVFEEMHGVGGGVVDGLWVGVLAGFMGVPDDLWALSPGL